MKKQFLLVAALLSVSAFSQVQMKHLSVPASTQAGNVKTIIDNDKDGIDDRIEHDLLEKYRPYFKFSRREYEEHYNPCDVLYYLRNSTLKENESKYSIDALSNNPSLILTANESGKGFSNILVNTVGIVSNSKLDLKYQINPKEDAHGHGGFPGRHGNTWNEILSLKNVGLYGHVVPYQADQLSAKNINSPAHDGQFIHDPDAHHKYYKIEYWQFFGYNNTDLGGSRCYTDMRSGEHEGDWCTVQLLYDPVSDKVVSVMHYAHGIEMRFNLGAIQPISTRDKNGLEVLEYRGENSQYKDIDINDENGTDGYKKAQQNILRFYHDPNGENFHPVVYIEYGGHEFWPSENWSFVKSVAGLSFSANNHDGLSSYFYLTSTPPNLGEVELPLNETPAASIILKYNGKWGCYHCDNDCPQGPSLHNEWTWPASSSVRWLLPRDLRI